MEVTQPKPVLKGGFPAFPEPGGNISRGGDSTASLGSLHQGSVTRTAENVAWCRWQKSYLKSYLCLFFFSCYFNCCV